MPRETWAPERVERLRFLWAQGWPTGRIAADLGVSRNAALNKVHRLGLPSRPSPIRRAQQEIAMAHRPDVPSFPRGVPTLPVLPSLREPLYVMGQPPTPEPPSGATGTAAPEAPRPTAKSSAQERLREIFANA